MATHAPARLKRAAGLRGIYAILGEEPRVVSRASSILDGGVRIVQYRAKTGIIADTLRLLREITRERHALLIVNDDWRAAIAFDCDGVHLGPEDAGFASIATLRTAMPDRLIGLSCGTEKEVRTANESDVDYVGAGSVYATPSKADAGEPIGVMGLRALVKESVVPVAAIGGVSSATIRDVKRTGAAMAAVISAIASAADARRAMRDLIQAWNG